MHHSLQHNAAAGFTLLELMFVIAIFSLLTATVIFNYGNFNNNIIMSNLAYEVALEIRQAQVYGLGVRGAATSLDPLDIRSQFNTRYGVFFDVGTSDTHFMLFSDSYPVSGSDNIDIPDGNGLCDSDNEGTPCNVTVCNPFECRQIAKLVRGITFNKICYSDDGVEPVDLTTGECATMSTDELHVTFARPYTDAIIKIDSDGEGIVPKRNAGIVMQSTAGSQRAVIVKSTGQVSVQTIEQSVDN